MSSLSALFPLYQWQGPPPTVSPLMFRSVFLPCCWMSAFLLANSPMCADSATLSMKI